MQEQNFYTAEDYFNSFQRGEERGFNYFFHKLYKLLVNFTYGFVNSRQVAEDIVEDCFLKLWEKRQTIDSAGAVKPYLFRAVQNRIITLSRKQNRSAAYLEKVKESAVETAADLSSRIIISESMHQVYLALENLPTKYQKLFTMLYVQGKEMKEIALELNLPLSTVKSQKQKALELLRKQLSHLGCFMLLCFLN